MKWLKISSSNTKTGVVKKNIYDIIEQKRKGNYNKYIISLNYSIQKKAIRSSRPLELSLIDEMY